MKIGEAIGRSGLPLAEARALLGAATGHQAAYQLAHADSEVPPPAEEEFLRMCARRRAGHPIAYLVGRREFYGLDLVVSPSVLIPRPETELLVDLALARVRAGARRVLDLGTGSGAIALAVACHSPAEVWAAERSAAALELARANAERLGACVHFLLGDWLEPARGQVFDVIVGNPPYLAADDPHLSEGDLRYEPQEALVAGPDGLDALRAIVSQARACLRTTGVLILEHGYDQAARVEALFRAAGYARIDHHRDLAGIERVCTGGW